MLAPHASAQSTVWVTRWDYCDDQLSTWYSPNNYVVTGCRNEGSTSVQMLCENRVDGDRVWIKEYSTLNCAGASSDSWVPEGVCTGHNGNWIRYSCETETIVPDMFAPPVSAGDIVGYKTKWTGQCGTSEFAATGINPEPMYRCTVQPGNAGVLRKECRRAFQTFRTGTQTDYPDDCAAQVTFDQTFSTTQCYSGSDGLFFSYSCDYPTITPPSPPAETEAPITVTVPIEAPSTSPQSAPQSAPELEPSTIPQSHAPLSSPPTSVSEPTSQSPSDAPSANPSTTPTSEPSEAPSTSAPSTSPSGTPSSSPQSASEPESPTSSATHLSATPFSISICILFASAISLL
jgi:hypothetical protein